MFWVEVWVKLITHQYLLLNESLFYKLVNAGSYTEESIAAIHPMKRLGTPEDIANGILYLASDESSFMTGNVLFVDGGYNAA